MVNTDPDNTDTKPKKKSWIKQSRTAERKAADILEKQGFIVQRGSRKPIVVNGKHISRGEDLFGFADVMAIGEEYVLLVQVTISKTSHTNKEVREFWYRKKNKHIKCELWRYDPETRLWDIYSFNGDGKFYSMGNDGIRTEKLENIF